MLVYRIESEDGKGAYGYSGDIRRPGTKAQKICTGDWFQDHPTPGNDGNLSDVSLTPLHYFGFISISQLLDWWPKSNWKYFAEWNEENPLQSPVGLSVYEVSPLYVETGDKQLVFLRNESQRITFEPFRDNVPREISNSVTGPSNVPNTC